MVLGATRTKEGYENIYARQRFVTCCKAFGIQAIDSVYIDIKDIKGLKKQCEEGNGFRKFFVLFNIFSFV